MDPELEKFPWKCVCCRAAPSSETGWDDGCSNSDLHFLLRPAPVLDYHITVTTLFINVTALSLMPPEMAVYVYAPLLRHQNFTS